MDSSSFRLSALKPKQGETLRTSLKISESSLAHPIEIPVAIIHGTRPGPTCFISSTIHGDEMNGIDITQKIILEINPKKLAGTLLIIPIVNVPGFFIQSRYLPYNRDLNRFFPGKKNGNNAERMAHALFSKIIQECHFGIDLHTAAKGHLNLPHIRGNMKNQMVKKMARTFGTTIVIDQIGIPGSLRYEATQKGIPTVLFEAGEAGRFSRKASEVGLQGILNILSLFKMYPPQLEQKTFAQPLFQVIIKTSRWIRSNTGGILHIQVQPGDLIYRKAAIGFVSNAFGDPIQALYAPFTGIIIGITTSPLAIPGAGIIHLAKLEKTLSFVERALQKK